MSPPSDTKIFYNLNHNHDDEGWDYCEKRTGDGKMLKRRIMSRRIAGISVFITILMVSMVFSAMGREDGKFDRAKIGCGDSGCHILTVDPTVSVNIAGLPSEYTPGQSYVLTITVSGGPSTTSGGFNLEVSQGILTLGDTNVQINGGTGNQATHTHPNQRSWTVTWEAPLIGSGDVTFWVAGNAVNGNGQNTGDGWNLNSYIVSEASTLDILPPGIFSASIDGVASKSVTQGTLVSLSAIIDDTLSGNSNIAGANYTIGQANWSSSIPMNAVSPPFDNPIEDVAQTIDTTGWLPGTYDIYVYGWDAIPNYNTTSDTFATLIISMEQIPPEIGSVQLNGASSQTYSLSSIPTLTISATIDDSSTGNSDIGGANFTLGFNNWGTSQSMALQNPPSSPTEVFSATITPPNQEGSYVYFVYAWDSQLNYNTTNIDEYVTLIIIDDVGPEISDVLIDGLSSKSVVSGTEVTLSAVIDESQSGNSNIQGANFTIGPGNWSSSTSMDAFDSTFDSSHEEVVQSIDTSDWSPGSYTFYVYASDSAQPSNNHNISSTAFATLIIQSPPSNIRVTLGEDKSSFLVQWDPYTEGDIAGFNLYRSRSSGSGYVKITSLGSQITSYVDSDLEDDTTYYYVLTAHDSEGNETSYSNEANGTIEKIPLKDAQEESSLGLIIILLVIIVVITIIVFILWKKKTQGVK
jgi:hypothetical protein